MKETGANILHSSRHVKRDDKQLLYRDFASKYPHAFVARYETI